jgi:hypothetical protein
MRIFSASLRLATIALLLAAAPAWAQSSASDTASPAESTVPEDLQGLVGDFVLEQDDETLPKCPVTLTDQEAIGGWAITMPEACPAPYPPADSLMAWNVDPNDGSVLFLDAERHVVLRLLEDEDGLYDTDPNVQPRFTLLAPYEDDGSGGESDGTD